MNLIYTIDELACWEYTELYEVASIFMNVEQVNQSNNTDQTQPPAPPNASRRNTFIIIGVVFLLIIGGLIYWLVNRGKVSTDDAQGAGHLVPVTTRVAGYVRRIYVDDNQHVDAGQLLVQLDRRDIESNVKKNQADLNAQLAQAAAAAEQLKITGVTAPAGTNQAAAAVQIAAAQVAAAQKQVTSAMAQEATARAGVQAAAAAVEAAKADVQAAAEQVAVAQAGIQTSEANVSSAEAQATRAAADLARFQQLFSSGAVSKQALEIADATNTTALASLRSARSGVTGARATLAQARARRAAAEAALVQAKARLTAARSAVVQAQAGVGAAKEVLAQARGQLRQAEAAYMGANVAPEQITLTTEQKKAAAARVKEAVATLKASKLQLSYTSINSPVNGIVSQKSVEPGQYMQPGQMLMAVVPLNDTWVVANFKETQIEHMSVGQKADIDIDTYPGIVLHGYVQSIGAATGAQFSLLPPQNATGNFVKVVQRIPVKIIVHRPLPKGVVLRPGQNVTATVYVSK